MHITTNHVPRLILDGCELTDAERAELDYIDWPAIEAGEESGSFFRYRGQIYDLGEFQTTRGLPEFSPLVKWHGYLNDSFFSAIVVRWCYDDDPDHIIVGLALS